VWTGREEVRVDRKRQCGQGERREEVRVDRKRQCGQGERLGWIGRDSVDRAREEKRTERN
jgi:hypothetical protein